MVLIVKKLLLIMVLAYHFKLLFTLVAKYLEHTKITEILNTCLNMLSTALDSVVSFIDNLDDKS